MHSPHTLSRFVWVLASAWMVGCAGQGCGGCGLQPLPAGGLPADQTIEGGAQIRVTPTGFSKLTSIIPGIVNDTLAGGFCLPKGQVDLQVVDFRFCDANPPGSCGNDTCAVDVSVDQVELSVPPGSDTLRIRTVLDAA